MSYFNKMTAEALRGNLAILKNAHYNLSPGVRLDVPTAKDEIEQVQSSLLKVVEILEGGGIRSPDRPALTHGHPDLCRQCDLKLVGEEMGPLCFRCDRKNAG